MPVAEGASLAALLAILHLTSRFNYLLFHSLAELFSICIAAGVFFVTVNGWSAIREPYVRFVGLAYAFVALLDFLHLLSYKGMHVFPDYDYYAPQFWIAARYLEAFSMIGALAFQGTRRRLNGPALFAALALATAALTASIFLHVFPSCFEAGRGLTRFKIASEYLICGLLVVAMVLLRRRRALFDTQVYRLIELSLALAVAMELCFTLYTRDSMSDAVNELGHQIKILSFYAVYKALVVTGLSEPVKVLFRRLKASEEAMAEAQRLAHLGTWEWSLPGDRWTWSKEMYEFSGLASSAPAALAPLLAALEPADAAVLGTALDACRRSGTPFEILVHRCGSPEIAPVAQIRGRAEDDAPGRVTRIAGTIQDVTDAQRALLLEGAIRDKERFEALLQTSGDGVHVLDPEGKVVEANDRFCQMLGYARDEVLRMNVYAWEAQFSPEELRAALRQFPSKPAVFETRHRRSDGSVFDVEISCKAIRIDGRTLLWNASRDITERKRAQERLTVTASVFSAASEGIVITDAELAIVEVNDAFTRITGYARDEVLGRNPWRLRPQGPSHRQHRDIRRAILETGHWSGELWSRRKDGSAYAEAVTISTVRDAAGRVRNYVGMITDVTQIKAQEERLRQLAHHDALTGLPNRVLATDRLRQSMLQCQRRSRAVAVAFLDLDGFKSINDRYGHDVGDRCLVALARALQAALRDGDTLARLGGDEFLAVLPDLSGFEECEPIVQRLIDTVAVPRVVGEHMVRLTVSVGLTLYPQDGGHDPDQLVRHADQAMYAAKQAGKNRFHLFDVAHDNAIRARREGVDRVRRAMADGEFVLYYQPKVEMMSGRIVGAEALIRWLHPDRGLLAPGEFLPMIADHPVGIELDAWVLGRALSQIEEWRDAGLDLPVSVNVGAAGLLATDFAERLRGALAAHPRVPPSHLNLEILESGALENLERVSRVLRECGAQGVSFALDDFGTGYSSLSYLKHLPVELIKIDQSFVRDILSDAGCLALVQGVIGLARTFGRTPIAEGVETVAHGVRLVELGCELGQGYGIARPMPAEAMVAWAAKWAPDPSWRTAVRRLRSAMAVS